jgi:hypothetical protein
MTKTRWKIYTNEPHLILSLEDAGGGGGGGVFLIRFLF